MITIMHGEDSASSRKYFIAEKEKSPNSVVSDGENVTLTVLMQTIQGDGLFSNEKKLFIQDFFSKRKPGKEFDEIIVFLKKNEDNADIFFWEGKELTKKHTALFPKAVLKLHALQKTMFSFLDSIKPSNGQNLVFSFHKALETTQEELVFFMLIRQFRLLLALCHPEQSEGSRDNETIDEVKRLAPWQKSKLQKQAQFFTIDTLKKIYKNLYDIDLGTKTGILSLSLVQAIDFLLLDI